jgi:DNA-binding SARP family transcriptional activator
MGLTMLAGSGMPPFRLTLFGGFSLIGTGGEALRISAKKARALLAYLALRPDASHSRAKLSALLWEDVGDEQARASLRQTLTVLRRTSAALGASLESETDTVAFHPPAGAVDVACFEQALAEGGAEGLKRAVDLYAGELLDGLYVQAPAFDSWLLTERQHLREQALDAHERLIDHHRSAGRYDPALSLALRLVALDPLRETARRTVMALYARTGHPALALQQYREFRTVLAQELDVAPEPETEALHREILEQRRRRRTPPSGATTAVTAGEPDPAEEDVLDEECLEETVFAVREDVREPDAAVRTELRQASLFIAELPGLTGPAGNPDPEEAHLLIRHFHDRAGSIVEAFGGRVERRGDGLLAIFGVPVAHGNDCERAVRAAQALHRAGPEGTGEIPATAIGVTCGSVVVEMPTGSGAGAVSLTGPALGLAERLAAGAGAGRTLISGDVGAGLRGRLVVEPVQLDGIGTVWLAGPFMPDAEGTARTPFAGRRAELRQFRALVEDRVAENRGEDADAVAIWIRGEPGIGKSRLVQEFRRLALEAGFDGHTGLFLDFGVEREGNALSMLVHSLLGQTLAAEPDSLDRAIDGAVTEGLIGPEQTLFLRALLNQPLPPAESGLLASMDETARTRGLLNALAALLGGRSRARPQLVVLEDVHWAEPASLSLLGGVAKAVETCPILFVLTMRPGHDEPAQAWRAAARGVALVTMDLAPLRPGDGRAIAATFPVGEELREICVARAGGNPLFLEQLLLAGLAGSSEDVPGSIRSVVLARLDRLDPADRRAIQAASILGQRFTLPALRHLLEAPDYTGTALSAQGLIQEDGPVLAFEHALVADATYMSLLKSRRQQLHRRAAMWFEGRDIVLHAQHLDRAGDPNAARAHLDAACDLAGRHETDRAIRQVERALEIAADPALTVEAVLQLGGLLHDSGRIEDSRAAFERALELAQAPADKARALIGVAEALRITDRLDEALEFLDQAEPLVGDDDALRCILHFDRANVLFPLCRIDDCLAEHARALEYARRSHSPELEARALGGLGDGLYVNTRMMTALSCFEACVEQARAHGFARIEVANLYMVASIKYFLNRSKDALADLEDCARLAARIGHARAELLSHLVMVQVLMDDTDSKPIEDRLGRIWELAGQIGSRRFQGETLLAESFLCRMRGDRDAARQRVYEARAICRQIGMGYLGPRMYGELALVATDAAERDHALAEGQAILAAGAVGDNFPLFYRDAMQACLNIGDWDRADRFADVFAAHNTHEPIPWADFYIARTRALAAFGRGGRDRALRLELARLAEEAGRIGHSMARLELDRALAAF